MADLMDAVVCVCVCVWCVCVCVRACVCVCVCMRACVVTYFPVNCMCCTEADMYIRACMYCLHSWRLCMWVLECLHVQSLNAEVYSDWK